MNKKVLNGVSVQKAISLTGVLLGLVILSNCAYSRSGREPPVVLVREPRMQFEVEPNQEITLTAIPGELFIKGVDGVEGSKMPHAPSWWELKC
jgi:hypothetical protein